MNPSSEFYQSRPGLTSHWSRRPPASARASRPLSAAAEAQRCDDCRGQGAFAPFAVCLPGSPGFLVSSGSGGARQTRRWSTRLSGGGSPPAVLAVGGRTPARHEAAGWARRPSSAGAASGEPESARPRLGPLQRPRPGDGRGWPLAQAVSPRGLLGRPRPRPLASGWLSHPRSSVRAWGMADRRGGAGGDRRRRWLLASSPACGTGGSLPLGSHDVWAAKATERCVQDLSFDGIPAPPGRRVRG
jgi:hypothetical protein